MKKILGLVIALVAVIGLLGTGTWAYFNDVATSGTNTITAGTLALDVGGSGAGAVTVNNVKPADTGKAGYYALENTGSVAGDLYMTWGGGDSGFGTSANLSSKLKLAIVLNTETGDTLGTGPASYTGANLYYFDPSDSKFKNTGLLSGASANATNYKSLPTGAFAVADDMKAALQVDSSAAGSGISLPLPGSLSDGIGQNQYGGTVYVLYYFPNATTGSFFTANPDNNAQGGSIAFKLKFALVQHGTASETP